MGEAQEISSIVSECQVVVLMGGLGTRLGLCDRPKSMADVNGKPFFDYQLELLGRWGFHKFLFLAGYQSEILRNYYGDGSRWNVDIRYSFDGDKQMGTGGALKKAEELLEEDFLLLYGDSFMDIDYQEVVYRYLSAREDGFSGLMTLMQNRNQYDNSNVIFQDGQLLLYDKKERSAEMEYIDYGISMLSKSVLKGIAADAVFDLADLLASLSKKGGLAGMEVVKRFYEIGSQEALDEFRAYAKSRFDDRNKAVFFDRDGVINELVFNDSTESLDSPFRPEEFQYRNGILEVMHSVSERGYRIFIVTNQPAAAKGKVKLQQIYDLNHWLEKDLGQKGIRLEFISVCPHHPTGDKRSNYWFLTGPCGCRKPKSGLINGILQVYNIDIPNSYMIGDSYVDVIAGKNAGLKTIFWGKMKCDACHMLGENRPDHIIQEPLEIADIIMADSRKPQIKFGK